MHSISFRYSHFTFKVVVNNRNDFRLSLQNERNIAGVLDGDFVYIKCKYTEVATGKWTYSEMCQRKIKTLRAHGFFDKWMFWQTSLLLCTCTHLLTHTFSAHIRSYSLTILTVLNVQCQQQQVFPLPSARGCSGYLSALGWGKFCCRGQKRFGPAFSKCCYCACSCPWRRRSLTSSV